MSSAAKTKIFGMSLGIDPKLLVIALVALAGLLFWFNSRGDENNSGSGGVTHVASSAPPAPAAFVKGRTQTDRRRSSGQDRNTLRLRTVDPSRGDIDPVLRLDFLERLSRVEASSRTRNLFEIGPAEEANGQGDLPVRVIPVKSVAVAPVTPQVPSVTMPTANIPYKYYGFAKPVNSGDANRGFFMEGDNIFVATEGQLIQQRYLVVQLTSSTARLEDTQLKLGQTLQLVPEAAESAAAGMAARQIPPDMNQMVNQGLDENQ
jgi:hypothetical protein